MKRFARIFLVFMAIVSLASCKEREYSFVAIEDAREAFVFFDGPVADNPDLFIYGLELGGVFTETKEEFALELVLYNQPDIFLPEGWYYGSNWYGDERMLYGKDGLGSYMWIKGPQDADWRKYPIDGGNVDVDTFIERDGNPSYKIRARVYSLDAKYDISYVGRPLIGE